MWTTNLKRRLVITTVLLAAVGTASARTIRVDDDGPADFNNIQAAINDSNDGDVIEVQPGIYTGPGNRDIDFLGKAITVRSTEPNDPAIVAATIVHCQHKGRGFYFHNNEDGNSVLAGFTITRGKARQGGGIYCGQGSPMVINCILVANSADSGGGMSNYECRPTVANSTFTGNAAYFGGGMENCNGNPMVTNCTFSRNSVGWSAGGMLNNNSDAMVSNCTFSDNSAQSMGGGMSNYDCHPTVANSTFTGNAAESAGGMENRNGNPMVTDCTFRGNSALFSGGGMKNKNANPIVTNCTFSSNSTQRIGAGMCNGDSSPRVVNCLFADNVSDGYAGGMSNESNSKISSPTVTNCLFINNRAGQYSQGGGIDNHGGALRNCSPVITNCTFIGNSAGRGGAVYNRYGGRPTITNSIFIRNRAKFAGGGMCSTYSSKALLTNSTFVGNSSPDGNAVACNNPASGSPCDIVITNCILWDGGDEIYNSTDSTIRVTYSDVQGDGSGLGNIDADPLFVDADGADDIFGTEDDNLRLSTGSPCIDAGDNNSVPADTADLDGDGNTIEPIPQDLDGNRRIVGDVVDMGAYEFFVPPIEVAMRFTPQALNPGSQGNWVKAHLVLPEGFVVEDVDTDMPAEIEQLGIQSEYMNVFVNEDGLVEIEAAFGRGEFCSSGPFDGTVTVTGLLTSGQRFVGTDTIKIVTNSLKYVAGLASRWLEEDCSKPGWCGGLDVDQDSIVNFVDFALFDGCCIEIITQ